MAIITLTSCILLLPLALWAGGIITGLVIGVMGVLVVVGFI